MDTPAVMLAMPAKWRYSIAPAMMKEFFKPHFFPREFHEQESVLELALVLPGVPVLQRIPHPAEGSGHEADIALHRRSGWRTTTRADFSGRCPAQGGRESRRSCLASA
jgi:hypothetical protein